LQIIIRTNGRTRSKDISINKIRIQTDDLLHKINNLPKYEESKIFSEMFSNFWALRWLGSFPKKLPPAAKDPATRL